MFLKLVEILESLLEKIEKCEKPAAVLLMVGAVVAIAVTAVWARGNDIAILGPSGAIAHEQRSLLFFGLMLSLLVVVPVFALTFFIVWRYREGNHKATYKPDWHGSNRLEAVWWGVPLVLILIMSVVTWKSSHSLDPFRPLASKAKPLTVQVVALQWKWLFIYPEQSVASVNYLAIPAHTPINFEITADAPMNSFWIPKLGGQIYAMSGMSSELHLIADKTGTFEGVSANLSGEGFADMHFKTVAMIHSDFNEWVQSARQVKHHLDQSAYNRLTLPGLQDKVVYYSQVQQDLYNETVMKFMDPSHSQAPKPQPAAMTEEHSVIASHLHPAEDKP